jgi:hypothetical protein
MESIVQSFASDVRDQEFTYFGEVRHPNVCHHEWVTWLMAVDHSWESEMRDPDRTVGRDHPQRQIANDALER